MAAVGASAAHEAHEWERCLGREIAVAIRRCLHFHALPERKLAARFLLQGAPRCGAPLYALIFPVVRRAMRSLMRIDVENAARSGWSRPTAVIVTATFDAGRGTVVRPHALRWDIDVCALTNLVRITGPQPRANPEFLNMNYQINTL